jgi:hypothetical protein
MQKSRQNEKLKKKDRLEFYESCGNIFKDLGYSDKDSASLILRAELMLAVKEEIKNIDGHKKKQQKDLVFINQEFRIYFRVP